MVEQLEREQCCARLAGWFGKEHFAFTEQHELDSIELAGYIELELIESAEPLV